MSLSESLVSIRMRLLGGKETAAEADAAAASIGGVAAATDAAAASTAASGGRMGGIASKLRGAWAGILKVAKFAALGFAGIAAGVAIWGKHAIHNTEELAKTTLTLHQTTGASVQSASSWLSLIKGWGGDMGQAGMAVKTFSSQIQGAVEGSKGASKTFQRLGFDTSDLKHALHSPLDALFKVSEGLEKMPDGATKMTAATKLFGKGWKTMVPILAQGSEKLHEQIGFAEEYGAQLGDHPIEALHELKEAQIKASIAMTGLEVSFTNLAAKPLTEVIGKITDFAQILHDPKLDAKEKADKIERKFNQLIQGIGHAIERAAPMIAKIAGRLGLVAVNALIHAFFSSDVLGKVVIASFVWKIFGGPGMLAQAAKLVGFAFSGWFGAAVVAGIIAFGIWESLDTRTKEGVIVWAHNAATSFWNFFIGIIREGIHELNELLSIDVGPLHIEGPIPEPGNIEPWHTKAETEKYPTKPGGALGNLPPGAYAPGGPKIPGVGGTKGGKHPRTSNRPTGRVESIAWSRGGGGGGMRTMQPIVLKVDRRVLADVTAEAREDEEARL